MTGQELVDALMKLDLKREVNIYCHWMDQDTRRFNKIINVENYDSDINGEVIDIEVDI